MELKIIATILERPVIEKILTHLGLVGRRFRRLHAHGLIAKIPRTRR